MRWLSAPWGCGDMLNVLCKVHTLAVAKLRDLEEAAVCDGDKVITRCCLKQASVGLCGMDALLDRKEGDRLCVKGFVSDRMS